MKPFLCAIFLCVLGFHILQAQQSMNMNLLGNWDDNSLPVFQGGQYSDIWGYAANGREYAIMGSIAKVHFLDVTTTNPIVEVARFDGGNNSVWRDFKTYQHYAYGVADQNGSTEGLMIFDLSNLPSSVTLVNQTTAFFNRAHNIFVDTTTARMYVAGSSGSNGNPAGLVVLDLTNPASPVQLSSPSLPGGYVHDVYVRNDTAYCSHGTAGLYVYDFANPASPVFLGSISNYVESGYNHSSWLTNDGSHMVFADETYGRGLKIATTSDLTNISVTDVFRSTLLAPAFTNSIAHNPFIKDDYVYISYYHDGVQVFDISDPNDVVLAAYYDTYPENTNYNGWFGAWGVYPYLPSGRIIASDILHGLFVLELDQAVFPVEWLSFEARAQEGRRTALEWRTAREQQLSHYEVEHSLNGRQFEAVGKVYPAGADSEEERQYRYLHPVAASGMHYYRIRQVDLDGSDSYSEVRVVYHGQQPEVALMGNLLQLGEPLLLERRGPVATQGQWTVFNTAGVALLSGVLGWGSEFEQVTIDVQASLPAGSYWLEYREQGSREVLRFVVVR
jgi:choice-of-anchor B domain-containing protein